MAAAVVQVTKSADTNDAAAATVVTQAWGASPTAGNPIVVWVTYQQVLTDLASVKNGTGAGGATGSDTFTLVDRLVVSVGDNINLAAYICQSPTQTNAITANFTSTTAAFRRITAVEVSGAATTGQPNAHAINASNAFGTGADAATSTAATTTLAGCLILGMGYDESATTIPALGTGFTSVDTASWSAGDAWRVEKQTQSAAGSIAATFTDSVGGHSIGVSMVAIAAPTPPVLGTLKSAGPGIEPSRQPRNTFRLPPRNRASVGAAYSDGVAEAATLSDSSSTAIFGDIAEAATLSDAFAASAHLLAAIGEALTITDLPAFPSSMAALRRPGPGVSPFNNAQFIASPRSTTRSINAYAGDMAEALTLTDAETGLAAFLGTMSEAGTPSHSQAALVAFAGAIAEAGTLAEAVAGVVAFLGAVADSLTATEAANWGGLFDSIGESATLTHAQTGRAAFTGAEAEALTPDDAVARAWATSAAMAEAVTGTDSSTGAAPTSYSAAVAELLSIIDAITGSLPSDIQFTSNSRRRLGGAIARVLGGRIGSGRQ
jgi:hypothetical protein